MAALIVAAAYPLVFSRRIKGSRPQKIFSAFFRTHPDFVLWAIAYFRKRLRTQNIVEQFFMSMPPEDGIPKLETVPALIEQRLKVRVTHAAVAKKWQKLTRDYAPERQAIDMWWTHQIWRILTPVRLGPDRYADLAGETTLELPR